MTNRLTFADNMETLVQNIEEDTHIAACKRNGYKQVNAFLTTDQFVTLEDISDISGVSKKDLVTKMIVDALPEYMEKVAPLVALKKQYEDAVNAFKLAK